jgi:hypothetical protein
MAQSIEERVTELRAHPVFRLWTDDAIAAQAECDVNGHDVFIDGKCLRCRADKPVAVRNFPGEIDYLMAPERRCCPHWTRDQGCPLHGDRS